VQRRRQRASDPVASAASKPRACGTRSPLSSCPGERPPGRGALAPSAQHVPRAQLQRYVEPPVPCACLPVRRCRRTSGTRRPRVLAVHVCLATAAVFARMHRPSAMRAELCSCVGFRLVDALVDGRYASRGCAGRPSADVTEASSGWPESAGRSHATTVGAQAKGQPARAGQSSA